MARRIGVRVLTFSLGFGPKLINIKRGGTEYCISAIPLGGYVKMAGENPEDNRTGAADEFLSKGKWQRFQVLVMGPIMNLVLAVVVMAVVLYQGAQVPAFEQQAVVIGAFADSSPARRPASRPAIASSRWTASRSNVGPVRDGDRAESQARTSRSASSATAGRPGHRRPRAARARTSWGTSASGRSSIPRSSISARIPPPPPRAFTPGDVVLAVGRRERRLARATDRRSSRRARASRWRSRSSAAMPSRRSWSRRRRSTARCMIGAQLSPFESRTVEPGLLEAVKLSVAEELGVDAADRRDARRPVHARDVGEAADGAGRHRRSLGDRRAGRMDLALQPDGDDQPQPRAAQPDADPGARRRPHLHPRARRASRAATSA